MYYPRVVYNNLMVRIFHVDAHLKVKNETENSQACRLYFIFMNMMHCNNYSIEKIFRQSKVIFNYGT